MTDNADAGLGRPEELLPGDDGGTAVTPAASPGSEGSVDHLVPEAAYRQRCRTSSPGCHLHPADGEAVEVAERVHVRDSPMVDGDEPARFE